MMMFLAGVACTLWVMYGYRLIVNHISSPYIKEDGTADFFKLGYQTMSRVLETESTHEERQEVYQAVMSSDLQDETKRGIKARWEEYLEGRKNGTV
jgi:hypothetical protein